MLTAREQAECAAPDEIVAIPATGREVCRKLDLH